MSDGNEVVEVEGEHRGDALAAQAAAGTPRRSQMSNLVARLSTGGTQTTTTRKSTPPTLTVPLLGEAPAAYSNAAFSEVPSRPSGQLGQNVASPSRDIESGFEAKAYVVVDRRQNRCWRVMRVLLVLLVILLNNGVTGVLAAYLSRAREFDRWLVCARRRRFQGCVDFW